MLLIQSSFYKNKWYFSLFFCLNWKDVYQFVILNNYYDITGLQLKKPQANDS